MVLFIEIDVHSSTSLAVLNTLPRHFFAQKIQLQMVTINHHLHPVQF